MKSRAEIFEELTKKAADTYRRKNADYGDSFVKVRQKYPNSVLVRLNDKLNRLEVLMGKSQRAKVKDESIEDTLLDLANYSLMELTERLYEKQVVASDAAASAAQMAADVCVPSGVGPVAPAANNAATYDIDEDPNVDRCVMCGEYVVEGRMICHRCESAGDNDMK